MSQNKVAREVEVHMEFDRIGEIDIMRERFYAEITITLKWTLNETIDRYDPRVHWNPKIKVENTYGRPEVKTEYDIFKTDTKTKVIERRDVRGYFWERMEINCFPTDVQELSIILVSKAREEVFYLKKNISYLLKKRTINTFVEQQRYKLYRPVVTYDAPSYDIEESHKLRIPPAALASPTNLQASPDPLKCCFTAFCSRKPQFFYWNAFFLIFLITVTSLAVFTIEPQMVTSRISSTLTILLTSISFKWVTNRSIPMVNYLTSLDKYSIVCIFYLVCCVGWHAIAEYLFGSEGFLNKENVCNTQCATLIVADRWVLLGFFIGLVFIHVIFFLKFIGCRQKIQMLENYENKCLKDNETYRNSAVRSSNV